MTHGTDNHKLRSNLADEKKRAIGRLIAKYKQKGLSYGVMALELNLSFKATYLLGRYGSYHPVSFSIKNAIKRRDKRQCRHCGSKTNLQIHHIDKPRDNRLRNLITLCASCHGKEEHSKKRKQNESLQVSN